MPILALAVGGRDKTEVCNAWGWASHVEVNLGIPHGWQEPSYLGYNLLLLRVQAFIRNRN